MNPILKTSDQDSLETALSRVSSEDLPSPLAIKKAKAWLKKMRGVVERLGQPWKAPHCATNAQGELVFEWSSGKRDLTVFVGEGTAEYIISWGISVIHEMGSGHINTQKAMANLWQWLVRESVSDLKHVWVVARRSEELAGIWSVDIPAFDYFAQGRSLSEAIEASKEVVLALLLNDRPDTSLLETPTVTLIMGEERNGWEPFSQREVERVEAVATLLEVDCASCTVFTPTLMWVLKRG